MAALTATRPPHETGVALALRLVRPLNGQPTRKACRHFVPDSEGRLVMSSYCILGTYTDQGIRAIKDSPKRIDAGRDLAKSMGAELKEFYLAMGSYDFVVMMEAPSEDIIARYVLALASRGNVRTTTLKIFNETQYKAIIGKLP
jgi:uncharacterized protein with GYD domain